MSVLLLKPDSNTSFRYIADEEIITQTVNITPNTLTCRVDVRVGNTTTVVENWSLDFSVLKAATRAYSNTLFEIKIPVSGISIIPEMILTEKDLTNLSLKTLGERLQNTRAAALATNSNRNIQILVKDFNGSFDTCDIIVFTRKDQEVISNATKQEFTADVQTLLDRIVVSKDTTYNNPEYNRYVLSSENYVDYLHVECIHGIADKTRVEMSSGGGTFRVLKNSVEGNDKIWFKVGFMNYPNLVTFIDQ